MNEIRNKNTEYPELKEPCKTLIEIGKCLGCNKLELKYFTGDKNCKILK